MSTTGPRSPAKSARGRVSPLMGFVALVGIMVVLGAIWIGFVASNERHPGAPRIIRPSSGYVVSAPSTPPRSARPGG